MTNAQIALLAASLSRINPNPKYYEEIRDAQLFLNWLNEKDKECLKNNTSEPG